MIAAIFTTVLLTPLLILIFSGRGDNLIAGYNTASKKEKEQFDIKRLRLVISGMLLLAILAFWVCLLLDRRRIIIHISLIPICFIGIFLANTWAKKK